MNAKNLIAVFCCCCLLACEPSPQLEVSPGPLSLTATLGHSADPASLEVSNTGGGQLDVTVSTDHEWIVVAPQAVSLPAGASTALTLQATCDQPHQQSGSLLIAGGDQSITVRVASSCTLPSVSLDIIAPPLSTTGIRFQHADEVRTTNAKSRIQWRVSSPWEKHPAIRYTIGSDHSNATARPTSGQLAPGSVTETELEGICTHQSAYLANITINVDDQAHQVPWTVQCDLRRVVKFDIVQVRIGNADPDQSGYATFTAPIGYSIFDQNIHFRHRIHAGVSVTNTTQPEQLSYQHEVAASLLRTIENALLSGNDDSASAKLSEVENFIRSNYTLRAATHASITYRWTADSETFRHGSYNDSYARITLERVPTTADASRVERVIQQAIASGEAVDVVRILSDNFTAAQ